MMKMSTTITENNKRREFLHRAMAAQIVIVPTVVVAVPVALVSPPSPAAAAAAVTTTTTTTNNKPPPILPLLTTARRLHAIPTFAIVDGYGVPFHTYDKDTAGGLGYFFTSYRSAEYVLEDAKVAFAKAKADERRRSNNNNVAKEKREGEAEEEEDANNNEVPDSWGQARIVSIPLDVVMQLTVKKTSSIAQNGQGKRFNTYYQVIPNQEEQNAALRIEDGPRYRERGRVPLFYIDGLQIPFEDDENNNNNNNNNNNEGGSSSSSSSSMKTMMNPVYLHIQDLKDEWQRQHPSSTNGSSSISTNIMPPIKVRELNETFRDMIRPGGKDISLSNLIFIPSLDNVSMAKAIAAGAGGGNSKYRLGEMILTK
jgi:hypothetical protein